ncbi:MAG: 3-isopropylmalate dehydratase small subunit, partial [Sinobacterium sp.]|nr:3-isopropylmalate dehydratase small subunit [Sinobacterium sp.]
GFRCVIAPSFADIFFNNCFKNGILPIVLSEPNMEILFSQCEANEGYSLTIDLPKQCVISPQGDTFTFEVDEFRKHCLLNGLDDIGLTLEDTDVIKAFEIKAKAATPWLFAANK